MVMKTAIITLVSALLIAIMALSWDARNSTSNWANTGSGAGYGARGGNAMSVTGASGGYSGSGQRSNWGSGGGRRGGSMSITGASGSYSGGGQRGSWGDDDHDDDHDGWDGDDD